VSYVPAAYYAHLAAFRGRLMQREDESMSLSSGQSGGSGEQPITLLDISPAYANKMFYA
jgi:hypothetical protein